MTKLLIASKNNHKIEKITCIFADKFTDIKSLNDIELKIEIIENANSFIENAKIKSLKLSKTFDGYVIATDGGAVIPALTEIWNPLFTKRFAGENKTDEDTVNAMLKLMENKIDRRFWFIEAFVICKDGDVVFEVETTSPIGQIVEKWDGRIKFGAYLLALWYLPNREKMFFDLTREEIAEEENTWRDLGEKTASLEFSLK